MCCPLKVGRPSMLLLLCIRLSDYNVKYVYCWEKIGNQIQSKTLAHRPGTSRIVRTHREQISGVQLSEVTHRRSKYNQVETIYASNACVYISRTHIHAHWRAREMRVRTRTNPPVSPAYILQITITSRLNVYAYTIINCIIITRLL